MATEATPPRPSARATARLAGQVGRDLSGFREQLRDALDEAARLEAAGRVDLAVELLEEQRAALADVHRRLEHRVADAAVEREAEAVVAAVPVEEQVAATATPPGDDAPAPRPPALVGRLVVSAATAIVGLALLLGPDVAPDGLTIAGIRVTPPAGAPGAAAAGDASAPVAAAPTAGAAAAAAAVDAGTTSSTADASDAVARATAPTTGAAPGGADDDVDPDASPEPFDPLDVDGLLTGLGDDAADVADDDEDEQGGATLPGWPDGD